MSLQVVMNAVVLEDASVPLWRDVRTAPVYVAGASAAALLLSTVFGIFHNARDKSWQSDARAKGPRAHVAAHGGGIIFAFKLARAACVLALLGLYTFDFAHSARTRSQEPFAENGALELMLFVTYLYTSGLALLNVAGKAPLARASAPHLVLVLLASCAVYGFRDVWPHMTYTMHPIDACEGSLLWIKIALLAGAGIVIPLTIPRQYVPLDPEHPSTHPNSEQTCSILSLLLYSFLDQAIHTAYSAPRLRVEMLPELADYDRMSHLVKRSFGYLDVFSGARRQHLFFALMKVFGRQYALVACMLVLQAFTSLFAPIGINRVLAYIETGGQGAVVRPWVWCMLMFLGPFMGSLLMQFCSFITTGMLVRAEGMLTQLIFEHALRLRVKSETADAPTSELENIDLTDTGAGSNADDAPKAGSSSQTGETNTEAAGSGGKGSHSGKKTHGVKKAADAAAQKEASNFVGKMNNIVTTDVNAIVEGRGFITVLVFTPTSIVISLYFLYLVLGWSAFVGMAILIVCLPIPGYLASVLQDAQKHLMKRTDGRVETVSEMTGVLRMIKMFGYEAKMLERVGAKRTEELRWLRYTELIRLGNNCVTLFIPVFMIVATYGTFTLIQGSRLTPSIVFPSLSVFMILRSQIGTLFSFTSPLIQAKVSLDRVTEFLQETELLDQYTAVQNNESDSSALVIPSTQPPNESTIGMRNASFTWSALTSTAISSARTFTLRVHEELTFQRGVINLIVGATGAGKTSLLMALLGEMHFVPLTPDAWVSLPRRGGVAYAAQESWVQNETIRDNILFGSPYDRTRYNKVIYQCALRHDLLLFDAGDRTEVGEKGLTLSGGQKARLTLARAIYSSAEIILLDDVLAALDVHTAKWIVNKCLKGDLVRGRTVILVTHNVALAGPISDFVVSLGSNGTIAARGSYQEVLSKDKALAQEAAKDEEILKKTDDKIDDAEDFNDAETDYDGKLIAKEEVSEGHISYRAMNLFWATLGGDHPVMFWVAFLGGSFGYHIFTSSQSFFLGRWADAYRTPGPVNVAYYLAGFFVLVLCGVLAFLISIGTYVFGVLRAAKKIHALLVDSILGTTLRWLDITPTSRIVTRCTKDIKAIDGRFARQFQELVGTTAQLITQLVAIALITPAVIFPGIAVFLIGAWFGNTYTKTHLPIKREMSNNRAPILGHFGAAIIGLTSIRAYGAEEAFRCESYRRIENYIRSGRIFYNLNRWMGARSDFLGSIFSSGLAVYMIYGPVAAAIGASNVGFSLTMATAFSRMILMWFRVYNDFEIEGNSLERIQAYLDIEQEPKPSKEKLPPAAWPASGDLRVEGLSARYSPDGPTVLHNLSFSVKSGERVGIVGRTGGGKSSLTLSLLRCIYSDGSVYYDGVNTANLNLDVLRTNITIIPQVPELLSGTLRENLDPFGEHNDAALNSALRASGLFSLQSGINENRITLDSQISGGGGNLSVGQRQILALARALVRGSKLLILDEATSSIDYETDAIIQSSLRHELGDDVTLLTVAHRLQTIMDADKIMVLDVGRIVEFDCPELLLEKDGGLFKSLVDESEDKETLYAMARDKA